MLPQVPRLQQHTHVPNTQTHAHAVVRHSASTAKRASMCAPMLLFLFGLRARLPFTLYTPEYVHPHVPCIWDM